MIELVFGKRLHSINMLKKYYAALGYWLTENGVYSVYFKI